MKIRSALVAAAIALISAATSAEAATPYAAKVKCAVGGEEFTYTETASYSTWGQRPDGKPYGSWTFPLPIPECPGNRLPMYRAFKPEEVERLSALLITPAFRNLGDDSPYYRAAWLEKELRPQLIDAAWLLLRATWQADGDPARKARYQREFLALVKTPPGSAADVEEVVLHLRAANAERELGEFDKASARLAAVSFAILKDEELKNIEDLKKRLGAVIARRESHVEPLDMIPTMSAAFVCVDLAPSATAARDPAGVCKSGEVLASIAQIRASKAAVEAAAAARRPKGAAAP